MPARRSTAPGNDKARTILTSPEAQPSALVTLTGNDRPGLTSALFTALAELDDRSGIEILDVEQVVIRDRLVLGVLLRSRLADRQLQDVAAKVAADTGMQVDVSFGSAARDLTEHRKARHHVIVLGRPLRAGAVGRVASAIAEIGGNIDSISRLSDYPVTSLEMMVSGAKSGRLRTELSIAAAATGVDIAVEKAGLHRRSKRLIVMDVDSTLVQGEFIDALADRAGCGTQVASITAAAMRGELDFAEALHARVRMLRGLAVDDLEAVRATMPLTAGARTLVRTLKRMGYQCGIVSGGFTQFTDHLAAELGMDFAAANTLEIEDGLLTGRLVGAILDRAGKAQALTRFAAAAGIPMSQTVAVGDGANDLDMLKRAGLGIAFNANPAVREQAHTSLNQPFLDAILFFLGISRSEVESADADEGEQLAASTPS